MCPKIGRKINVIDAEKGLRWYEAFHPSPSPQDHYTQGDTSIFPPWMRQHDPSRGLQHPVLHAIGAAEKKSRNSGISARPGDGSRSKDVDLLIEEIADGRAIRILEHIKEYIDGLDDMRDRSYEFQQLVEYVRNSKEHLEGCSELLLISRMVEFLQYMGTISCDDYCLLDGIHLDESMANEAMKKILNYIRDGSDTERDEMKEAMAHVEDSFHLRWFVAFLEKNKDDLASRSSLRLIEVVNELGRKGTTRIGRRRALLDSSLVLPLARMLRELTAAGLRSKDELVKREGARAYGLMMGKSFGGGERESRKGSVLLRSLMADESPDVRLNAAMAYATVLRWFPEDSPEIYVIASTLREFMTKKTFEEVMKVYGELAKRFAIGHPEARVGARHLRLRLDKLPGNALHQYAAVVNRLAVGDGEVAAGIKTLDRLVDRLRDNPLYYGAYAALFRKMKKSTPEAMHAYAVQRLSPLREAISKVGGRSASSAYVEISKHVLEGANETYDEVSSLRDAMKSTENDYDLEDFEKDGRLDALATAYRAMAKRFSIEDSRTVKEARAIREVMEDQGASPMLRVSLTYVYDAIVPKLERSSPEITAGLSALRNLIAQLTESSGIDAVGKRYVALASRRIGDRGLAYREASGWREIIKNSENVKVLKTAFKAYGLWADRFKVNDPEVAIESDAIVSLYLTKQDARSSLDEDEDAEVIGMRDFMMQHFQRLRFSGFWKAALRGSWMEHLGLSAQSVANLRGFVSQSHFVNHLDHWITLLDAFRDTDKRKRLVLDAVFKRTNSKKWNQVKKTLKTLRRLNVLRVLPSERESAFYQRWHIEVGKMEDPRTALVRAVEREALDYLGEQLGNIGAADILFKDQPPDDAVLRSRWQNARRVKEVLVRSGLIEIFSLAASFMDERGIEILRQLINELALSQVHEGKIQHDHRYQRIVDQLKFSSSFVERWRHDWIKDFSLSSDNASDDAHEALLRQSAAQLTAHANGAEAVEGVIQDVPQAVSSLIAQLEISEVDRTAIEELWKRFERNYNEIRDVYGDLFANIRTDLKNLSLGLEKGTHVARRSERVTITGDVLAMARHGIIPVSTCQRLAKLYSMFTNGSGQPLNKILWGQFKVANYEVDGQIVARRLIEATMDLGGAEHLLVERLYVAGSFARIKEFDQAIVEHADEMGIPRERVHFLDRSHPKGVPAPLRTGAEIYRDSRLGEIDPAEINKKGSGQGEDDNEGSGSSSPAPAGGAVPYVPPAMTGTWRTAPLSSPSHFVGQPISMIISSTMVR